MSDRHSPMEEIPFGTVGGEAVSLAEALRLLKLDFSDAARPPREWPQAVVERVVLRQAAAELRLAPSDDDLEAVAREFREERDLHSARETERFLGGLGCTVEDFGEAVELLWTEHALRRRFAEEPAERHFLQHSTEYDTAVLSELVVEDEEVARELALQIREEAADFAVLARRYSREESRGRAGFLGELRRSSLQAAETASVFGAEPDEVVGPFRRGRQFRLLRVHEARRAVFTDAVRAEIAGQLWQEWLAARVRAARPEVTILSRL
jgi:parvulin-like peptidyl-prolyl isomerase